MGPFEKHLLDLNQNSLKLLGFLLEDPPFLLIPHHPHYSFRERGNEQPPSESHLSSTGGLQVNLKEESEDISNLLDNQALHNP